MANLIYAKIIYEKLNQTIDFVINKLNEEIVNELAILDNNRDLVSEANNFINTKSYNVINNKIIINDKLNELQSIML